MQEGFYSNRTDLIRTAIRNQIAGHADDCRPLDHAADAGRRPAGLFARRSGGRAGAGGGCVTRGANRAGADRVRRRRRAGARHHRLDPRPRRAAGQRRGEGGAGRPHPQPLIRIAGAMSEDFIGGRCGAPWRRPRPATPARRRGSSRRRWPAGPRPVPGRWPRRPRGAPGSIRTPRSSSQPAPRRARRGREAAQTAARGAEDAARGAARARLGAAGGRSRRAAGGAGGGAVRDAVLWLCGGGAQTTGSMSLPPARPVVGLVLMLHGCKQNPDDFATGTGMNALAERHRLIIAYPGQTAADNPSACWNWFRPGDQRRDAGEPAISCAGLARALAEEFGIAPGRVFAAGLSAGGRYGRGAGRELSGTSSPPSASTRACRRGRRTTSSPPSRRCAARRGLRPRAAEEGREDRGSLSSTALPTPR